MRSQRGVAISPDGVPIQYDVHGTGDKAIVLVHGWCCERHYWRQQVDHLAPRFAVVCVDLAGHGESGRDRKHFTISAFGDDVAAVVNQLELDRVILIGHSMGGGVIVEAARRLGSAVVGLVGVDTLWNVDQERSPEDVAAFMEPFYADFPKAARGFVRKMFTPTFDADLAQEITSAVSAFPRVIGTQELESFMGNGANLRQGLDELRVPIALINSPYWQTTNLEAAHRRGMDVRLLPGAGHFLMLEDPAAFNELLDDVMRKFNRAEKP